jgi:hypothetical protein
MEISAVTNKRSGECDLMVPQEHFSWCAVEIRREILRPQNPESYPSQKKAAQRDVTTETALKSGLRKTQQISKYDHSNNTPPPQSMMS